MESPYRMISSHPLFVYRSYSLFRFNYRWIYGSQLPVNPAFLPFLGLDSGQIRVRGDIRVNIFGEIRVNSFGEICLTLLVPNLFTLFFITSIWPPRVFNRCPRNGPLIISSYLSQEDMEVNVSITNARMMKLKGELSLMKEVDPDIKPNFSQLARETGVSRQTIARIWAAPLAPARPRQKKKSQFDPYYDEIRNKFEQNATTIQAIFKYFQSKYGSNDVFRSYDSFKSYVKANKLNQARSSALARVRYETAPGEELQVDWKESLAMTLKNGEVIHFNLFTAVYGYSRYVKFIYSRTKTTEDFLRCVIETVESAGGLPKYIKTDNMSAIVKSVNGRARKLPQILQFEKDLGVPIRLCKVRNPQSKGKVESANRFVQWLEPYQNELSSEEELIQKIDELNRLVNKEPSRTTDQVRAVLMKKEKEHLRPINNRIILDSYFKDVDTQVVPNTLLVNWKGHGYSVPKEYVGKRVKLVESDDHLQVYYTSKLIAAHVLSEQPFNYAQEHYVDGLKDRLGKHDSEEEEDYEDRITRKARESLALMKNLKGNSK